jgi:hypothetical protein
VEGHNSLERPGRALPDREDVSLIPVRQVVDTGGVGTDSDRRDDVVPSLLRNIGAPGNVDTGPPDGAAAEESGAIPAYPQPARVESDSVAAATWFLLVASSKSRTATCVEPSDVLAPADISASRTAVT